LSLYQAIDNIFNLLWLIIVIRLLLSWFPDVDWWKQPFKFVHEATEPILEPFRRLIPPMGGLDISPIFAFICLQIIQTIVLRMVG
jgi:YggT family protein